MILPERVTQKGEKKSPDTFSSPAIHSNLLNFFHRTPFQAPLDGSAHDPMSRIPLKLEQFRRSLDRAASGENLDRKRFEQQSKPRSFFRPRDCRGFHNALLAIAPRDTGPDSSLKLHQVQMPPDPLGSQVGLSAGLLTFRTGQLASPMTQQDLDLLSLRVDVDLDHFP
jgi:hypothetical protein